LLFVESTTIGTAPVNAVGVPVGVPAQAPAYMNPSIAVVARATPVALATKE
jgi:hypothetical protein